MQPVLPHRFNVRVYGILINADRQILLSDEYIRGGYYTKFPGGGLEFGEGTRECLTREWLEETGQQIKAGEHVYTTDFFQLSAFDELSQIISIYYLVQPTTPFTARTIIQPFDFPVPRDAVQVEALRWMDWKDFNEDKVSLPIDKVVAGMLKRRLPA